MNKRGDLLNSLVRLFAVALIGFAGSSLTSPEAEAGCYRDMTLQE
jgi:hypothetical protein